MNYLAIFAFFMTGLLSKSDPARAQLVGWAQPTWVCSGYSVVDGSWRYCGTMTGATGTRACGPNYYGVTCNLL